MRKLVLISIVVLNLSCLSSVSYAEDCTAPSLSTVELKNCLYKNYQTVDKTLNQVYQQLMAKLEEANHKKALKTAQQAWLKYRDAHCEYEVYLNQGGTVYGAYYTACLTALTEERVKQLKESLVNQ
ncbi:lysozyme inhibitor LprI family protein [uncultured Thiothrix sp.]|uniref:lysozyme inhibitor LprI family protein n=1 Tax=uncultured Thiothrix sp. TaxID=223185 RepID=UPI00261F94E2|nr:lysozyme inhibitor LprI family protein [uncultured Thiothrix sp.]